MPGGDRTGPWGAGPMTGRAAGYCAGHGRPGFMNPQFGRGYGGGGRGWRHWYHATSLPGWARFGGAVTPAVEVSPDQERRDLESQAAALQDELEAIRARLNALAGPPAAK
mgnify:CR=1 FL=1